MFRIGEFSKIAQVSGRLLRYYDEIGLLSPDYTDPQTGYRYYSAQQLPRLNRILVLKDLGLSLDQITQLLEKATSVDEIRGMLTLRKAQIEQAVQTEMVRLRMVESRLEQIDRHGHIQEPDVIVKSVDRQQFLSLRAVFSDMAAVRGSVQMINRAVPALIGRGALGQTAVLIHTSMYEPEVFDLEIGFLLTGTVPDRVMLPDERVLTVRELPAVETMATLAYAGPVEHSHQGYSALASWLEAHAYQMVGIGREIIMQLPRQAQSDKPIVMELQLPVAKRENRFGGLTLTSRKTVE